MKTEKELEKELIVIIHQELKTCTQDGTFPNLCSLKRAKQGRDQIVKFVIKYVSETGESVQTALSQLESSWE